MRSRMGNKRFEHFCMVRQRYLCRGICDLSRGDAPSTKLLQNGRSRHHRLSNLQPPKGPAYTKELLLSWKRQSNWQRMLHMLLGSEGSNLDSFSYNLGLAAAAKARAWRWTIWTLSSMLRGRICPDTVTFNSCLGAFQSSQRWSQAFLLFRDMHELALAPDTMTFSSLISACLGHRWARAAALMSQMTRSAVQANLMTHNALLNVYRSSQQWQRALHHFRAIQRSSLQANVATFNITISACAKESQFQQLAPLVQELRCTRMQPDEVTLSCSMGVLEGGGSDTLRWEASLDYLRELGQRADAMAISSTMTMCAKVGQWERVLALLGDILEPTLTLFAAALRSCDIGNQWLSVLQIVRDMQMRRVQANAVVGLSALAACENSGDMRAVASTSLSLVPGVVCSALRWSTCVDCRCAEGILGGRPADVLSAASFILKRYGRIHPDVERAASRRVASPTRDHRTKGLRTLLHNCAVADDRVLVPFAICNPQTLLAWEGLCADALQSKVSHIRLQMRGNGGENFCKLQPHFLDQFGMQGKRLVVPASHHVNCGVVWMSFDLVANHAVTCSDVSVVKSGQATED